MIRSLGLSIGRLRVVGLAWCFAGATWLGPAAVQVSAVNGEEEAAPAAPVGETTAVPDGDSSPAPSTAAPAETPALTPTDKGWVRLSPQDRVWVDAKKKRLLLGGKICLREGMLEMFACPQGTKEHESIVSIEAKAFQVHAALIAIGGRPGQPVQYDPVYRPANGSTVRVEILWKDADGKSHRRKAQELIRHVKTQRPMTHEWVFAGSGFWENEQTGERFYQAEGGELICLSNFSTAMLDLPIESPRDNAELMFEANTPEVPPRGTPVHLLLTIEQGTEPQ